jgi:hypothetical protein
MYRAWKTLVSALLLPAALALPGCGNHSDPAALDCQSDDQCPSDARCTGTGCVANTPPVATFAVTGELQANALIELDGSASRDPDELDSITSYDWSLESDGAPCAPPEVASTQATVLVRFSCAGRYRARLVVLDAKQAASAPASRLLDIGIASGSTSVDAGPDQAVAHACNGSPLTCRLASTVRLGATTSAAAGATFRWSVQAPAARPLDATRRVRFLPDASAQSPAVEIETDGTAISGDWVFRVEVRDGLGTVGADLVRLSVGNRAPVIHGGPAASYDHIFSAEAQLFSAGGSFTLVAVDEDGDPILRQLAFHHAGDAGAVFQGQDLGDAVSFLVAVPRTSPADALHLAGAPGLERAVAFTATDANGASASATFPVVVGNRPPEPVGLPASLVFHSFDGATRRYLAEALLGTWRDPDGDPLDLAAGVDAECVSATLDAAGRAWLHCARPFSDLTSLAGFVRDRTTSVRVSDPWTSASRAVPFRIANRAPVAGSTTYAPAIECRPRGGSAYVCRGTGSGSERTNLFPAATVYPPSGAHDPDGDPIDVRPSSNGLGGLCLPGVACTITALLPRSESCDARPPRTEVPYAVTDGVATTLGQIQIDPTCR